MVNLIVISLYLITIFLVGMMLRQGLTRQVEFLNVRNFFLVGFIVFQLTSAAVTLSSGQYNEFPIFDVARTGLKYLVMAVLFLWIFLLAYRKGWFVTKLAAKAPVGNAAPGVTSMLTLAIAFLIVGLVFQLVLIYVPLLGKLTGMMGVGIISVAAGMAAWAYAPRLFNPLVGAVAAAIVLVGLLAVLQNAFGRRDLLSVVLACLWGAYHGYWKWLRPSTALLRLGALAAAGLVLLAAFTAVRSGGERERSAMEYVQLMRGGGDIRSGVVDVLSGQLAGQNSLWLIENYPSRFDYVPLHSMTYFFVQPVPRDFWSGKPDGLGRRAVTQAGAGRQKSKNYSIGPGILGHIAADNPWLSLPAYAIALGLLIRFFDEMIRRSPANPFVVLPIGVALGQFVGLARGELGLFLFQAVAGMIAAWFMMTAIAKVMALMGWRMANVEQEHFEDELSVPADAGETDGPAEAPVDE